MQGYDAAITFEVAPVFTGSNADKDGRQDRTGLLARRDKEKLDSQFSSRQA